VRTPEACRRIHEAPPQALNQRACEDGAVTVTAGVWAALGERVDVASWRPELGWWVEVNQLEARGGRGSVMVANRRDLVYYRLEPVEAELLRLMDGSRTVADIVVAQLDADGTMDATAVVDLVRALHAGGFLTAPYTDVDAALRRAIAPNNVRARLGRFARTLSVEWSGAERLARWLYDRGLRVLFTRAGATLAGLVAALGALAFVAVGIDHHALTDMQSVGIALLLLFGLNVGLIFVHELGHATALVHYRRRVRASGVRMQFGTPAVYVDSSDALMLPRDERMVQSFAGSYFELVATGVAAICLWLWPHGSAAPVLASLVALSYFVLLLNLVPLLELDGYWILTDALRVPDLRPRAMTFMRHDLWAKLRGRERLTRAEFGLGVFGTVGVLFAVFVVVASLFLWQRTFGALLAELWDAGPWGIAALALFVAFVAGPLLRGAFELAGSGLRQLRPALQVLRFRAQRSWRAEAARLLDRQPVFDELPSDVLQEVAAQVHLMHVEPARAVIRQGSRPDAYFLVRSGTYEVIELDPHSGDERVVHTMGPGESFGEFGLATGAARTASVRALTRGDLFRIDKATFDRLLADRIEVPSFAPSLQMLAELRALPPFRNLDADELAALAEHGSWQVIAPETTIIREGEPGDAFYVVAAGQLAVVRGGAHVATLGPGEHVGETALLTDQPRTATVRTLTPARLYRLDPPGFHALVAGSVQPHATTTPAVFARE
jgi:CRP-like cAMP-binding protein